MKKSKKPMLSELNQMAYLMGYDRKKTIFEQNCFGGCLSHMKTTQFNGKSEKMSNGQGCDA